MKIVKLTAENIKRLRAVEITPDGNTVIITGRNGQGKTSVLDSIWYALGGGPAAKGTIRPVRDGQNRAEVTVDLGDLVVTRSWTSAGGTALRVENTDGARYKSPQQMLDGLVGKLSFDPLTFAQQSER
ncbi:MAG: AAA family ATPase, partial [Acidimicrobiales bacterium]